jgi:hypothetical protein
VAWSVIVVCAHVAGIRGAGGLPASHGLDNARSIDCTGQAFFAHSQLHCGELFEAATDVNYSEWPAGGRDYDANYLGLVK